MIETSIAGFGTLRLAHVVCDYNGTLALDGRLLPGVRERFVRLCANVELHVITADTFGLAAAELAGLPASLVVLPPESQADAKLRFIEKLGATACVAIGNGRNDRKMLNAAGLGIALIQNEGAAVETITCAKIVATNIVDALDLLLNPKRLIATLRS